MNSSTQRRKLLEMMVASLEIPESAYETAKKRYEDIGGFLGRGESICFKNDPHVFPQGSFRLGTAIRPLNDNEEYDLDLACSLTEGISTRTHTQADLKKLVGKEIHSYRTARQIKAEPAEKHRCWRLEYEDGMSFHMDIVPSIPEDDVHRQLLTESMIKSGQTRFMSEDVTAYALSITDDRHPNFNRIADDWNVSNPEGYARWFESRMRGENVLLLEKAAQVDSLPLYKRKTSLQQTIQLLKRHRDQMFRKDPEVKPISIIITTLAAAGYSDATSLEEALSGILNTLSAFANSGKSFVPNPVNPEENFADRWMMPEYQHLRLRDNFRSWVTQACADFDALTSSTDTGFIAENVLQKMSVRANAKDIGTLLGFSSSASVHVPKHHEISTNSARPWAKEVRSA